MLLCRPPTPQLAREPNEHGTCLPGALARRDCVFGSSSLAAPTTSFSCTDSVGGLGPVIILAGTPT